MVLDRPCLVVWQAGEWVGGVAAVGAIQAVRIDAQKRADEIRESGNENLQVAAARASELLESWHTSQGTTRELVPVANSLRALARLTSSACLVNAAPLVSLVSFGMQLPDTYVYGGQVLLEGSRADLQVAVEALGNSGTIPVEVADRLTLFAEQFPFYKDRAREAAEVGTRLAEMESNEFRGVLCQET